VLQRLAEPDTRVDDKVLWPHASPDGSLRSFGKKIPDLAHHIFVTRILLHALGLAQHVHEYERTTPLCHQTRHLRVSESGDVVDDPCSSIEGGLGG
jgi:hypothetical protein